MKEKNGMPFTGERLIPGEIPTIFFFEHLRRFDFIKDLCKNKTVLDLGCGIGYGAMIIADYAKEVAAIDIDEEIIKSAKTMYKKDNLKFFTLNDFDTEIYNGKFDVIYCFEVIEHVKEQNKFIRNAIKFLKRGGIFIISTPNRKMVSPNSKKPSNPFHIREFNLAEFRSSLKKYFGSVEIYGQSTKSGLNFLVNLMRFLRINKYFFNASISILNAAGRAFRRIKIWDYQNDLHKSVQMLNMRKRKFIISKDNLDEKSNFIAICKSQI